MVCSPCNVLLWRWTNCQFIATQAASLVMLSMAPSMHYRHTYQPAHSSLLPTLAATTAIDVLSIYLPLLFLRPYGSGDSTSSPVRKENRFFDSTRVVNALLTSTIYQLIVYTASVKFLTTWLIESGWELESVARVHDVSEGVLLARAALMIPVGWAASEIIFYSPSDSSEAPEENEGPPAGQTGICAYLARLWVKSLSPRSRKIVRRTLLVAAYQSVNSTVTLAGTVKGGDLRGAGGVSGVWTVATLVVGAVLGWVGKV